MDRSELLRQVVEFFDAFVTAFQTFNGGHIAQRYRAPYLALNADGSVQCFAEHADIGKYFQELVGGYHAQGCRSCCYKDLDVVPLGSQSVLTTLTWQLLREDGSILSTWRESYTLTRMNKEYRIVASVDHAQGFSSQGNALGGSSQPRGRRGESKRSNGDRHGRSNARD